MPTYDYQCRTCGRTTEVHHSMLEEGPTTCEVCGGPLRRVIYPAGIIFKGSGFYKTDSRSSTSSSVSGASASKDAAKGDAKPAESNGSGDAASPGTSPKADGASATAASTASTPKTAGSSSSD